MFYTLQPSSQQKIGDWQRGLWNHTFPAEWETADHAFLPSFALMVQREMPFSAFSSCTARRTQRKQQSSTPLQPMELLLVISCFASSFSKKWEFNPKDPWIGLPTSKWILGCSWSYNWPPEPQISVPLEKMADLKSRFYGKVQARSLCSPDAILHRPHPQISRKFPSQSW